MALAHLGHEFEENELAAWCRSRRRGTTVIAALQALEDLGFEGERLGQAELDDLESFLADGLPPIVGLCLAELDPGVTGFHAVVVVGVTGESVTIIDPASGAEHVLPRIEFESAWNAYGDDGLVVRGRG